MIQWLPPNHPLREWNKLIVDFANKQAVEDAFVSLVRLAVEAVGDAGDEASLSDRNEVVRRMLHEYIDSYLVDAFIEADLDVAADKED